MGNAVFPPCPPQGSRIASSDKLRRICPGASGNGEGRGMDAIMMQSFVHFPIRKNTGMGR